MYYDTDKKINTKEDYIKLYGIIETDFELKDWNITKKEIVELCLGATLQKEISVCRPIEQKKRIIKILNSNLTAAAIKRNLVTVNELRPQINEEYDSGMVKIRVVQATIEKCYREKIDKHFKERKKGWLILHAPIEILKFHKKI
jgi:hypothetical protein